MKKHFLLLVVLLCFTQSISADYDTRTDAVAPKVFISGLYYDSDFIRSEIQFVNYVIDRTDADIHILITRQRTGSGGREYTLVFIGQNQFEARNDTIQYNSFQNDTWDDIRNKMAKSLKMGLMQYIAQTSIAEDINIEYSRSKEAIVKIDRWNNWIFSLRLSGSFFGEKYSKESSLDGSISANRITDDWKIGFDLDTDYNEDRYQVDNETIKSSRNEKDFDFLVVRSLTSHWSLGFTGQLESSTYSNIKLSYELKPAIEYNLFPYSESTHRQLRLEYAIGFENVQYVEETIYNKMRESIFEESMQIVLEIQKPWGSVETYLKGSHSFSDFNMNHLSLYSSVSVQLHKGLAFYFDGGISMIHDQYSLPKSDATIDEVLLHRRQLKTQYSYWSGIGIEFTFGSIYNNIVNPRFGGK